MKRRQESNSSMSWRSCAIEVAELQVFKSEQNRVPAALGESESHADSRFEVLLPWSRSPQRERGVRRSPKKVIKVMNVPLYSPTHLRQTSKVSRNLEIFLARNRRRRVR
jgi:hypothetical protein